MKLSKVALLVLKGSKDLKERIAEMMNVKLVTVYSWIQRNDDNLTKAAILQMISEETGLSEDTLLEREAVA